MIPAEFWCGQSRGSRRLIVHAMALLFFSLGMGRSCNWTDTCGTRSGRYTRQKTARRQPAGGGAAGIADPRDRNRVILGCAGRDRCRHRELAAEPRALLLAD